MAHPLFDALAGGMSSIENQSAIQSILDSQTAQETGAAQVEDDDVFQCGKCKKQFTSLPLFVSHKQGRCTPVVPRPVYQHSVVQGIGTNNLNTAYTANPNQTVTVQRPQVNQQNVTGYSAVSQASLTPLTHNMVLTDDQLLTFGDIGGQSNILQGSTLHLTGNTVQASGPFLSQVTQLTSRPASNVTILSPIQTSTSLATSHGSSFTTSVNSLQPIAQVPQQISIATALGEKTSANIQHIIKPSPTKAGRKSAQACAVDSSLDDTDAPSRHRPRVITDDTGKKKLICNYCGKVFTKNFDLQQHIRSHTGEKPFQCVVCGRAFAQKSNVKKHMSSHKVWPTGPGSTLPSQPPALLVPVEESEKAEVTITQPPPPAGNQEQVQTGEEGQDDAQSDKQGKSQNYKLKVVIDNSYLCGFCPEKFKTYYQLKSHMVKHKSVQVYRCVLKSCTATFKDLDAFLEHTTTHQDEMTYRCHQCNKGFSSLYELGVHQYTHSLYQHSNNKAGPRHFQCNKCLNKYATPEALEHHMNTTSHRFPCPHCQKNFTCERFLRRHLTSHGTEGVTLYECQVCHKTFKTEHYLKNHALIHTGEKPYECEECGAAFNRKDKLKRHNLIHDKRIRFKCPFKTVSGCDKEFNRPDKLKAHIITHSGVKPFACQICGKEFARRPHLKEHERAHNQEYPYKCSKCNRGFFRPKLFKEHKCENANGQLVKKRPFQPRRVKRKPGRPRKAVAKLPKENAAVIVVQGNKKDNNILIQNAVAEREKMKEQAKQIATNTVDNGLEHVASLETAVTEGIVQHESGVADVNHTINIGAVASALCEDTVGIVGDGQQMAKRKKRKECYVKAPTSAALAPVSMVEQYVTVQLTSSGNGDEIQAQLIPAADLAGQLHFSSSLTGQVQISPSSSTATFHPIQIIEGQPVTLTVSQGGDQLNAAYGVGEANVIDIPVDIVTVSDGHALVCSQEVSTGDDGGEQTYATIEDYGTVEGDAVLQGSENLINSSVEILDSEHVASIATLEN